MSLYCRGVQGSRTPCKLSYALRFRLFQLSGHCIRATPAVFPAVIRGHPIVRLSSADHRLSSAMLADYPVQLGFLLCLILSYLRSDATPIAVHQPSHKVLHIDFWGSEYDSIVFVIAETHTVHYQNRCNFVPYTLRLPLL